MATNNLTETENAPPFEHYMLVVDDDPIFTQLMVKWGERKKIHAATCGSIKEWDTLVAPRLFDIAIIDYYLDGLKEDLKGTEVADFMGATPVILVSSRPNECLDESETWPGPVRKFVGKEKGIEAILELALRLKADTQSNAGKAKTRTLRWAAAPQGSFGDFHF